jgi:hypothetical protein
MWPPSDETCRALIPLIALSMAGIAVYVVIYVLEHAAAGDAAMQRLLGCCILPIWLLGLFWTIAVRRRGIRGIGAWGYERDVRRKDK